MIIKKLAEINECELEKIMKTIERISNVRSIRSIELSKTPKYEYCANEYIVRTDKVYQDQFLKLTVKHA